MTSTATSMFKFLNTSFNFFIFPRVSVWIRTDALNIFFYNCFSLVTTDIQLEYLDLTPATDGDVLSGSVDVEDDNDEDLTGGNLGMLEDALSELTGREKQEDITDEIAYDIRPNKIQPLNEMVCFSALEMVGLIERKALIVNQKLLQ
jgi:hypothetical protein